MTIKEAIQLGEWEQFYINKVGEKFPVTEENQNLFCQSKDTKDWSLVSQKINK